MTYAKQNWVDSPAGGTPINAARLNHIENGIATAPAEALDEAEAMDTALMTAHKAEGDPHPQYETAVEATAKDTALMVAHKAEGDPHPQYETSVEVDAKMTAHKAEADPHPVYETSVEAAAKITAHKAENDPHAQYAFRATQNGPTASINAFLTAGTFFVAGSNASVANGYPQSAGLPGVLKVSGQGVNWIQEFTFTAGTNAGQDWLRVTTNTGTTWTQWFLRSSMNHPIVGATITDVGSPEGVKTAPIGVRYIDSSATNGALEWSKFSGTGNTGWRVTEGDTGVRNVPGVAGTGITATTSLWRRMGNLVSATLILRADVAFTSGGTAFIVPAGFRPSIAINSSPPYSGAGPVAIQTGGAATLWSPLVTNDQRAYSWTWTTSDAWPSPLPGTV